MAFCNYRKKSVARQRLLDKIMAKNYSELSDYLTKALGSKIQKAEMAFGELTLEVPASEILAVLKFLRDDSRCLFKMLIDICGVDYPDRAARFDVVYHLLSLKHNARIRVKVAVAEEELVPSVTPLFSTANWFEREAYDMYGIFFADHPDLRRILTDYGFQGHPFRKDFPLTGYVEVRYDEMEKRVVYEKVSLPQEFRRFEFESPWEGMLNAPRILPGDEKATK